MPHVFVLLASSTGMRVGELKQLRWSDLEKRQMDDGLKLVVSVRGETSKVRRGRTAVSPHKERSCSSDSEDADQEDRSH